jgi:hypothetical protein
MESKEKFVSISGYEGLYKIAKTGEIYSVLRNKTLKHQTQSNGYKTVNLWKDKKVKTCTIHRLIAQAFIPNPNNKPVINHKNLNKADNSIENLEWCSHSENIKHAKDNGLGVGEKNGNSKLTKEQVLEIREKYKFRKYTHIMLGNEYGVRENYIQRIVAKQVWKHI